MAKTSYLFVASALFLSFHPTFANAGFLDKLNEATRKLDQATQKIDQASQTKQQIQSSSERIRKGSSTNISASHPALTPTTNPIKGEWGNQVTCAGPNSATCQNGMDDIINCMHQSKGYYYRLVSVNLEDKFKNHSEQLSDQERKEIQEDIASIKEAVTTDKVVDPDPQNPQRWLYWLTDEDQQEINSVNSKYMQEVRKDCDDRFGGMARYSGNR